jgi:hypothetical protein
VLQKEYLQHMILPVITCAFNRKQTVEFHCPFTVQLYESNQSTFWAYAIRYQTNTVSKALPIQNYLEKKDRLTKATTKAHNILAPDKYIRLTFKQINMNSRTQKHDFAERLFDYFPKIELPLILLVFIGHQLKMNKSNALLFIIGLSLLATCYYFLASSKKTQTSSALHQFIYKLSMVSCAIGCSAILFKIQHWPMAAVLLIISTTSLGVALFFILINFLLKAEKTFVSQRHIIRIIIILFINLIFLTTPKEKLIEYNLLKEARIPPTKNSTE